MASVTNGFTPRFPDVKEAFDAANERQFRRSVADAIGTISQRPTTTLSYLDIRDFGRSVGQGFDDTAALQAALDAGADQHKVVSCGELQLNISGPLTMGGPGLVFDSVSMANQAGLYPTGSGYTVLTIGPSISVSQCRVFIWGQGANVNGVYLDNPQTSQFGKIHVQNVGGFGVKADLCWDNFFESIACVQCGNDTDYAFSLNDAGGTSNHTFIGHLQVELSTHKAIKIDASTLAVCINTIHSEGQTAAAGVATWDISAARSAFNCALFHAQNPSDATLKLNGEHSTFNAMSVQSDISVVLNAASSTTMTLIQPSFDDAHVSIDLLSHSGLIHVVGGTIGTFSVDAEADKKIQLLCEGTQITTVALGSVGGNPAIPDLAQFIGCRIGEVTSTTSLSAATFTNCVIVEGHNLATYRTVVHHSTITCASGMTVAGTLEITDSTINGDVTVNSGATLLGRGTRFNGALTQNVQCSSLLDAGCYATGAVTGLGSPTVQPSVTAQVGAVWQKGQRHHNLNAAVGQPPGWVCTTAGGTGTFVFTPEPNL